MNPSDILYLGTAGQVIAFRKSDGQQLWRTPLSTGLLGSPSGFVTVLVDGERVFAHNNGALFCLDARTGQQLWTDGLKGLGFGISSLAVVGNSAPSAAILAEHQRQEDSQNHQPAQTAPT